MGLGWRFGERVALFAQLDFGYHPGCQMCVRVRRDVPLWKGNIKCSAIAMQIDVDMRSYVVIMLSQLASCNANSKAVLAYQLSKTLQPLLQSLTKTQFSSLITAYQTNSDPPTKPSCIGLLTACNVSAYAIPGSFSATGCTYPYSSLSSGTGTLAM